MNKNDTENHKADRLQAVVQSDQVIYQRLKGDGSFPNNEGLPLLVYQGALALPQSNPAAMVEDLFKANGWNGSWRNGIYEFHHYHSTAHEVLGVYGGFAKVQLGGENGITLTVRRGDVVIIPAGVAHKNLGAGSNFRVVGAYPLGQSPDMCYGKAGERPQADDHIAGVSLPRMDPVYGAGGPLKAHWEKYLAKNRKEKNAKSDDPDTLFSG